jgi:predicted membrane protein
MDMDRWESRWERRWGSRSGRSPMSGIIIGVLIVSLGLMLLLDNIGIVRFHDMSRFWPLILVAFGVSRILESRSPAGYVWGGLVTLAGALILLDNLHILIFDFDIGDLIWPLLLIGFGVSLLLRTLDKRAGRATGSSGTSNPSLGMWAIFSGFKRRIDAQDFKGGEIVAVFGGVHIDLRHAAIAGDQASIDVNALFGGVDIRVPETWQVTMKGVGIFGAFEDKTVRPRTDPTVKSPELVITGVGVFAGIKADN